MRLDRKQTGRIFGYTGSLSSVGIAACLSLVACSAEPSGGRDASPAVASGTSTSTDSVVQREGRLVFSDLSAFASTVNELSLATPGDRLSFELKFPGFRALRATATISVLSEISVVMQSIMNSDGAYQVGNSILVQQDSVEYRFPDSAATLIDAIHSGASLTPYLQSGQLVMRPIARTFAKPPTEDGSGSGSGAPGAENTAVVTEPLLDAKYQYQFAAGSHYYKFVDEAYVDDHNWYLEACFRSKFEYQKGSNWNAAGESVEKSIAEGYVIMADGSLPPWLPMPTLAGPLNASATGNQNLIACAVLVPTQWQCIQDLDLYATFNSTAKSGDPNGYAYSVYASWPSEFASMTKCFTNTQ